MQILEVNKYVFITEYKVQTNKGIFIHSVPNETSHYTAREEVKLYAEKMSK